MSTFLKLILYGMVIILAVARGTVQYEDSDANYKEPNPECCCRASASANARALAGAAVLANATAEAVVFASATAEAKVSAMASFRGTASALAIVFGSANIFYSAEAKALGTARGLAKALYNYVKEDCSDKAAEEVVKQAEELGAAVGTASKLASVFNDDLFTLQASADVFKSATLKAEATARDVSVKQLTVTDSALSMAIEVDQAISQSEAEAEVCFGGGARRRR